MQGVACYYFLLSPKKPREAEMKFRKKLLFYAFFISISYTQKNNAFTIDHLPYQTQANSWVETYLYDTTTKKLLIDQEDLHLIAKLCYFSFLRSQITLKAQEVAYEAITSIWNGWQNIAQKRLDPSGELPHPLSETEKDQTVFWKLHDEHREIGTIYTYAVNEIVHGNALTTIKASKAVEKIRSLARVTVAQALIDVKSIIGKLFYSVRSKLKTTLITTKKGFSLTEHLWKYIPQLALYSFSSANNLNDKVSEEAWNTLKTVQEIGIRTWNAIEEARASFYLAHLKAIYEIAEKIGMREKLSIAFDKNGFITKEKREGGLSTL